MPDKIVNHFVLADGSIAKYDAEQLAGDIPEVVGIRTGYNGTLYPSAGDAIRGQVLNLNEISNNILITSKTANLYDESMSKSGKLSNTDEITESDTRAYTNLIPVDETKDYMIVCVLNNVYVTPTLDAINAYSKDKTLLSSLGSQSYSSTTTNRLLLPSGTRYLAFSGNKSMLIGTRMMLVEFSQTFPESYVSYEKVVYIIDSGYASELDSIKDVLDDISSQTISSLSGVDTQNQSISDSGALFVAGVNTYHTIKYPVTAGKTYWLDASTNYGNRFWCFYNENDEVVQLGERNTSGSTFTDLSDVEVVAPSGASYIVICYHTSHKYADLRTATEYSIKKKWTNKKWVCVGDSLTAENAMTTKHYFDYVSNETGITPVNMGVSGSGYARKADTNQAFYQRVSSCPTDADVVTIFGSFNDLGAGLPIGTVDDTDTTTLAGCINKTIDNLQTIIPLVNLGIVAPTPWDTTQPSTSGNAYNYVEMLKAICERRSIPFLDLWRCSNLRPWDSDFREIAYSKDGGSGTHPDENGHKLIAPRFEAFLDELLLH